MSRSPITTAPLDASGGEQDRTAFAPVMVTATGLAVAAVAGLGAAAVVAPEGVIDVVTLAGAALAAALVVLIPVRHLPSLALVLFVVMPQQGFNAGLVGGVSASVAALTIWVVRRWAEGGRQAEPTVRGSWLRVLARTGGLALVTWSLVLLVILPPLDPIRSVTWTTSFALGAVVPLIVGDSPQELRSLYSVWPLLTVASAVYVLVEFGLQRNFVFTPLYDAVGTPEYQNWSGYRSHGSFGHPLYAGTFFAVSFGVAVGRWMTSNRGKLWAFAGLAGMVPTVSRGALLAAAVAVVVLLIVGPLRVGIRRLPGYLTSVGALATAGAAVAATGLVQQRSSSAEGEGSAELRSLLFGIATDINAETSWLGSGAGTADAVVTDWVGYPLAMENSLLQILVSLGVVGLVALVLQLVGVALIAVEGRTLAGLGGMTALVVSISGYNALETLLPLHALMGVVFIVACSSGRETTSDRVNAETT